MASGINSPSPDGSTDSISGAVLAQSDLDAILSLNPDMVNKAELLEYYHLHGRLGRLRLNGRLLWGWFLAGLAKRVPTSGLAVRLQRRRGVRIGRHVYLGPGVEIDFLYPDLITLEDNVSIGMHTMIFAHANPTTSIILKKTLYPRRVAPVKIHKGAWIPPGCIILPGVTIGENAVIGAGSVVLHDVEAFTLVAGSPAKFIKKLEVR